jgi:creatinine amidohydrolase/Fe(II)-dependent formamide hydrolase-like protein
MFLMPVFFERMRSAEFDALPREQTLFLFTLGCLEDHGPHLPFGTDLMIARGVCERLGQWIESKMAGWCVVVYPTLPLSVNSTVRDPAIRQRAHVLRDFYLDSVRELHRSGFRHFAAYSAIGGGPQLTTLEEVGKAIRRKFWWKGKASPRFYSLCSGQVSRDEFLRNLWVYTPREHGGAQETAWLRLIDPSQVSASLPDHRERQGGIWQERGYWGNPNAVDDQTGDTDLTRHISEIGEDLVLLLRGAFQGNTFRSWFSVVPWNSSYFKVWIVLVVLFAVLLAWVSQFMRMWDLVQ